MKLGGILYSYKNKNGSVQGYCTEAVYRCDRCEKDFKERIEFNSLPKRTKRQREKRVSVIKKGVPKNYTVEIDVDYDICGECLDTMVHQRMLREGLL